MKRWVFVIMTSLLIVSGCTSLAISGPSHDAINGTPGDSLIVEPSPVTTVTPSFNNGGEGIFDNEALNRLRQKVASELDIEQNTLQFVEKKAEVWSDASLGCPEPGMAYVQILIDGWQIVFQNNAGELIYVHTESDLDNFIICDDVRSLTPEKSSGEGIPASVVNGAVNYIAEKLDINPDDVTVSDIASRMWPNACLGCAEREEMCLAVITRGYKVQVFVNGNVYAIHTDDTGSATRLCGKPESMPVGGE